MSPTEILSSLDAPGGELGGVKRPAPPHHRTVRDAVAWSYGLLDPMEKQAFRRLAVFIGGFDAEAARSVVPELSVELLARLVDKSLIAATESQRGRTRYRLLETVREYAAELLGFADEVGAARDEHLRHFAGLADRSLEEWLQTGRQWFVNELDDDYENVRAALEWAQASDPCRGLLVLAGTRDLFYKFGQRDGFRLAQLLLESCPAHDRGRALALIAAGELASAAGEPGAAHALLGEAREISARLEDPLLEAWAEWFLGITNTTTGQSERGREQLERSLELHRRAGNRIGEARALAGLGGSYLFADEPGRAKELYEAALSILVEERNPWGQGMCHTFLGMIAEARNDSTRSTSHYRQAIELLRPAQDATLLPLALAGQASVLVSRDPAAALTVLAAAYEIRERSGGEFQPAFKARLDRTRAAAVAKLGVGADRLWAQGRRLDVDDGVALAFGTRRPRPSAAGGLSARELEVAGLVAEGLANKAIAARLHLSVRTVEVHVHHILAKLGLANRTQLATWACERLG
jgi:non-specific serine/threonine protein kinase